jgi:SynChlorMet cassette radical SAM/SPASM protein ScmF
MYLTEGCNMKCRHCWLAPKFETPEHQHGHLDFDLLRSTVWQAKPLGLTRVKLTGGEPLLHPRIGEILDFIKGEDLSLTVETNGVLCSPELATQLAAAKRPSISVSLDGADAATHEWVRGIAGSFAASTRGVANLASAGLKPQIIMSVMRHNRNQMEALVAMAEDLGAGSVKFNIVMPTERGEAMHDNGETLGISELVETGQWVQQELAPKTKLRVIFHQPPVFSPLGSLFGAQGSGCGSCGIKGIIGLLADGSYALCGIGTSVPEMVFGLAGRDKLADVWHDNSVIKAIRHDMPRKLKGICGQCLMQGVCLGSCIAQNYYRHRDLWAPFWYCEEAHKANLFPASRLRP